MTIATSQIYLLVVSQADNEQIILQKLQTLAKGTHVHLLAIIENIGGFDLNKIMFDFKNSKKIVESNGYKCTSEVVKVIKGDDSRDAIIKEYALTMHATLI